MKKLKILLLIASMLTLMACGSSQPNTTVVDTKPVANDPMAGYPQWIVDPSVEDGLGAVGSAFVGAAGLQFARQEAMASARDELARQNSVKVANMFKSFTNAIGVGGADGVEKVSSNVSKQIANETLRGSKQVNMWKSPEGELFVHVIIPNEIAKKAALEIIQSETPIGTNDKALWQEFKSENAQEELAKAVEEMYK